MVRLAICCNGIGAGNAFFDLLFVFCAIDIDPAAAAA